MKRVIILIVLTFTLACLAVCAEEDFDGYIIKFKDEEALQAATDYINSTPRLMSAGEEDKAPLGDIYEPQSIYKTYDENLIKRFEEMGLLEYCDKDVCFELFEYDYNDPELTNQWAYGITNARRAWDLGIYGNNVTVAVLDSGVKGDHPDLSGNIAEGGTHFYRGSDGNVAQNDDYSDGLGHGTRVSGIIAAEANGVGVVGLAHRVKIIPVKIADASDVYLSVLVAGLEYVLDNLDVDVINLSLGFSDGNNSVKSAVKRAIDKNIIVVCASGNYGDKNGNPVLYPAAYSQTYPGVISVSAIQRNSNNTYQIASYSTYNNYVTIAAPGSGIRSTSYVGGYNNGDGTSFASPFVAAAAALVKSIDRSITPAAFRQALISTADKTLLGGELFNEYYGYGVIDVGALIEKVITDRTSDGFVSPIDRKTDGSVTVRLYNPSARDIQSSFIARALNSEGRLTQTAVRNVQLDAGEYKEYDISDLSSGEISCYFLEHTFLRPLYKVIKG